MGCSTFSSLLIGRQCTVRTDHNSLRWLQNFKDAEGQVARWLEVLAEFQMSVEHRPGKRHGNADALSGSNCQQCGQFIEPSRNFPVNTLTQAQEVSNWPPTWSMEELQAQQKEDSDLSTVNNWLTSESIPMNFRDKAVMSYKHYVIRGTV